MEIIATQDNYQLIWDIFQTMTLCMEVDENLEKLIEAGYDTYLPSKEVSIAKDVIDIDMTTEDARQYMIATTICCIIFEEMMEINIKDEKIADLLAFITFMIKENFKVMTEDDLQSNSFININFSSKQYGKYQIEYEEIKKNMLCTMASDYLAGPSYFPQIGYLEKDFKFPCITTEKEILHCATPEIINMTDDILKKVEGNILSLGLGIGYFEYMAALKEDVKSITVVEKDPDLIEIFKNEVLPHIEHPEKITIVKSDPYTYINFLNKTENSFDCCVVDIEVYPEEAINCYLIMKSYEKKHPGMKFLYFDENNIISDIQMILVKEMMETISETYESMASTSLEEKIFKKISKIYNDVFLFRNSEIKDLFEVENIIQRISDYS